MTIGRRVPAVLRFVVDTRSHRDRVIDLCERFAEFIDDAVPPDVVGYYRTLAERLRAEPGLRERRRIYRAIHRGADSGAGGWGDHIVDGPDGSGDVEGTQAFQDCRYALLRATCTVF